ncbi:hypothetical protein [Rathayibacter sp. AY1C5]|uniref:hypothetical protein n=1 Tax=Rathayibacter sp. AY1C5 TaxID=2080538 RepID=UPI0011AFEDF4|nr:hypothetical protein [Rathayibacter sp. AY1C5]
MADNLSQARAKLDGQRRAVREHIEKWKKYPEPYEKEGAWKTIQNAQSHIKKIRESHSALAASFEDTWRPTH